MRLLQKIKFVIIIGLSLLIFAQGWSAELGFDVNDVSILFPLDSKNQAYPKIPLWDSTLSGDRQLISESIFKQISSSVYKLVSGSEEAKAIANWQIVALRIDPCFSLGNGECQMQIRLVAQPRDSWGFADQAIHLLYRLNSQEFQEATRSLLALKTQAAGQGIVTSGKSLQPHPGLSAEMSAVQNSQTLGTALKKISSQFCHVSNLVSATMVGSDERRFGLWIFMGGDIHDHQWVATPIPNLQDTRHEPPVDSVFQGPLFQTGFVQGSDGENFAFPAPPERREDGKESMRWFLMKGPDKSTNSVSSEAELESLFTIANPKLTNPKNTDCVSCHLNNEFLKRQNGEISGVATAYSNPFGITGFSEHKYSPRSDEDNSEVRTFGYDSNRAVIAPITANSSAEVAKVLNQWLHLTPPTQNDCRDNQIFQCFNKLGAFAEMSQAGTDAYCLSLCHKR